MKKKINTGQVSDFPKHQYSTRKIYIRVKIYTKIYPYHQSLYITLFPSLSIFAFPTPILSWKKKKIEDISCCIEAKVTSNASFVTRKEITDNFRGVTYFTLLYKKSKEFFVFRDIRFISPSKKVLDFGASEQKSLKRMKKTNEFPSEEMEKKHFITHNIKGKKEKNAPVKKENTI